MIPIRRCGSCPNGCEPCSKHDHVVLVRKAVQAYLRIRRDEADEDLFIWQRGPLSEWGVLAKTDGTDAQYLANFGKNIQSCLFVAKSEEKKRLYSLLTRSRQLAEMLTAEKNR